MGALLKKRTRLKHFWDERDPRFWRKATQKLSGYATSNNEISAAERILQLASFF